MPKTLHRRSFLTAVAAAACGALGLGGCRSFLGGVDSSANYGAPAGPLENPLFLPPLDQEFIWNQLVDAVDDHFRIEREERVRLIGGILTEGRIDTFPTPGSTLLEPWRGDSASGYEKLHATFQSIRRRATVRLIPIEGGSLVDVVVQKELEDLDKPEHATAGNATLRHDGTLVRGEGHPGRFSVTLGWIPIGRDCALEQKILDNIRCRLDVPAAGGSSSSSFSGPPIPNSGPPAETIEPGSLPGVPGSPSTIPTIPPFPPAGDRWQPRSSPESSPRNAPPSGNILLPSRIQ